MKLPVKDDVELGKREYCSQSVVISLCYFRSSVDIACSAPTPALSRGVEYPN